MLQMVATLGSVLLAAAMVAMIAGMLFDDWSAIARSFARRRVGFEVPVGRPARLRAGVRLVRLSAQSAPQRAAA